MKRLTVNDFDPEVLKLFDGYVHGRLSRRDFLRGRALCRRRRHRGHPAGAAVAVVRGAAGRAGRCAPEDQLRRIPVAAGLRQGARLPGRCRRTAKGKLPAILVVHENRGLNPHIEDIARRLALDGFIAYAPDALFPLGGYPGDEDKARELFPKLDQTKTRADFVAAAHALAALPQANGKVGVVGFCYGGGIANYLATAAARPGAPSCLSTARSRRPADVAQIRAPLLIHDAGKDERILAGWPAYEAALKANNVDYQHFVYPGAEHGFNNDTTPRYDEAAAKLAWSARWRFFKAKLG